MESTTESRQIVSDEMWYNLHAHPEHYEMIDGQVVGVNA